MALDIEQQEKLDDVKEWWRAHGYKVILAVSLLLAAVIGWQVWSTKQRNETASASMLFDKAVQAATLNDLKAAREAAAQIMENHPRSGYATPAAWLAGQINHDAQDLKSAQAQYQFALERARDPGLEQLARLRLAAVKFEAQDLSGALRLLDQPFDAAFQGLAAQLRGDVLIAQGKSEEARAAYRLALEKLGAESPIRPLVEMRLDALGG